jgi:hypothetical protein
MRIVVVNNSFPHQVGGGAPMAASLAEQYAATATSASDHRPRPTAMLSRPSNAGHTLPGASHTVDPRL